VKDDKRAQCAGAASGAEGRQARATAQGGLMAWWDRKAGDLQRAVRISEDEYAAQHSEDDARRAAVHARQDMVLIASQLSSLNRQVFTVKIILAVLTAIVAYAVFRS
jgi:Cdc6-like AAA superfamily ATPase